MAKASTTQLTSSTSRRTDSYVSKASMEVVEQDLPGFRFHPTEEELLDFYLARVVRGKKLHFDIIGTLNIYRHDPWDLPEMAKIGEREWYFFVPRDRKAGNGGRPNRTTERGFWKATGSDRVIRSTADPKRVIGMKKTLVFYQGRAPRGTKTDWVMNEYRLPELFTATAAPYREDMVLCKIYRKATSLKELEQRAAMEEMQRCSNTRADGTRAPAWGVSILDDCLSSDDKENFLVSSSSAPSDNNNAIKIKNYPPSEVKKEAKTATTTAVRPAMELTSLQLPTSHGGLEWLQDPFLTQLCSPCQEQYCWSPYANLLYFQGM